MSFASATPQVTAELSRLVQTISPWTVMRLPGLATSVRAHRVDTKSASSRKVTRTSWSRDAQSHSTDTRPLAVQRCIRQQRTSGGHNAGQKKLFSGSNGFKSVRDAYYRYASLSPHWSYGTTIPRLPCSDCRRPASCRMTEIGRTIRSEANPDTPLHPRLYSFLQSVKNNSHHSLRPARKLARHRRTAARYDCARETRTRTGEPGKSR